MCSRSRARRLNLGYLPRLRIVQSSAAAIGQIFVPAVNWMLFAGTVLLVVGFGSSDALAGAYGIAVSATMLLAGIIIFVLGYIRRTERRFVTLALLGGICLVDLAFFCANSLRVFEGGWIPLATGLAVYTVMATWREGRRLLNWTVAREQSSTADFLKALERDPPHRVAGTAVYLTGEASVIPPVSSFNRYGCSVACMSDRSSSRSCAAKCRGSRVRSASLSRRSRPASIASLSAMDSWSRPTRWPHCGWPTSKD